MGRLKEFVREKKYWFLGGLGILGIWGVLYLSYLPDGKLRLVFCDVGQGDGIYIDLPDGRDVLIDGGPNRKILQCLGKNMPFWDRKLELVVLTHPQADHLNGLIEAVKRYQISYFVSTPIGNETKGYRELIGEIKKQGIEVGNVYAGDNIKFKVNTKLPITNYELSGEVAFRVLWPSREFVAKNTQIKQISTDLTDRQAVLGMSTERDDLNDFTIVMELRFGEFEALLTGDAGEEIQDDILAVAEVKDVEVFKIPHHGSKYGILDEFVTKAVPRFAVVSVGKNPWGHPSKEILGRLENWDIEVYRTDKNGNVKFTTDGKQIWVESDRKSKN